MAKGVRAIVAAAALGVGLLGAAGAARADGEYAFNYAATSTNSMAASGVFTLSGVDITSVNGNFSDSSGSQGAVTYPLTLSAPVSMIGPAGGNNYDLNAIFGFFGPNQIAIFNGRVIGLNSIFNGNISVYDFETNNNSSGLFIATLVDNFTNPVSPGSGGSSGGLSGTGTGGAGASGAAPSPEVNTLLGFLVVGGTVAFLKRRRKGSGAEMAAA